MEEKLSFLVRIIEYYFEYTLYQMINKFIKIMEQIFKIYRDENIKYDGIIY